MSNDLEQQNVVEWLRSLGEFLKAVDALLDDFMNKSKEYETKLKGVDFSNPEKLVGFNDVMTKDKAPVVLSLFVEIASLISTLRKFQEGQDDIPTARENTKRMIRNIDELLDEL